MVNKFDKSVHPNKMIFLYSKNVTTKYGLRGALSINAYALMMGATSQATCLDWSSPNVGYWPAADHALD